MSKSHKTEKQRCFWSTDDPLYIHYHDTEWGVPVHEDRKLFEFLLLEGFQAGLSWITVLKKRENFRKAFHDFDPKKIARYTERDFKRLMKNEGIIRNRLKIESAKKNAIAFLEIQKEFGAFDAYIWGFTGHRTLRKKKVTQKTLPTSTKESDAMSKDLKKRGLKFVGTTICYAYMQSMGMVNDHTEDCFLSL